MPDRERKNLILAGALILLVAAILAWAWSDAGLRPASPQTEPANLPQVSK